MGILKHPVPDIFHTGLSREESCLSMPSALSLAEGGKRTRAARSNGPDGQSKIKSASYGRVLLFGKHRELALYRAEVLRHSGFRVIIPRTRQEAVEAVRHGDFDAAILSYTLSADTVEELAEMVRQHCPTCPLITISQERTHDARIDPDVIVLAEEGPPALLNALRRVLGHRAQ
jgi:hypothetical protein